MAEETTATMEAKQGEESQALTRQKHPKPPMLAGERGLELRSVDDLHSFACYAYDSGMFPKDDTVSVMVVKLEYGLELGIRPMQALQNIMVINNRPALWGDAVPGICMSHREFVDINIDEFGKAYNDDYGFEVTVVRRGISKPFIARFTVGDAKRAGLWNNPSKGTWMKYPQRMLLNRARTFALRDAFPDALKGITTVEEARDIQDAEIVGDPPRSRTEQLEDMVSTDAEFTEQPADDSVPQQPPQTPSNVPAEDGNVPAKDDTPDTPPLPPASPAEDLMLKYGIDMEEILGYAKRALGRKLSAPDDVKPDEWDKVHTVIKATYKAQGNLM